MVRQRSALVLVAHADDETLGCGGTIVNLLDDGWDVDVVIVTDGLITARGPQVQDNRAACHAACATLGVGEPTWLGYPDQQLERSTVTDLSNAVAALDLAPDLIISHWAGDLNADHRLVAEVARIVGRPTTRAISILACEVPGEAIRNGTPFPANFYVDISATLDAKLAASASYEQELAVASPPRRVDGVRLLAEYHGMQTGTDAAEAFHVVRATAGRLP